MIFNVDHINKIIAHEKELQKSSQKDNYIRNCFGEINHTLINYFSKKNYLLHKIYFFEEEKNSFYSISFDTIVHLQNRIAVHHIHSAEELVNETNTIPFTKIILEKHLQGLILYKGKKPKKFGDILVQNLSIKSCIGSLSTKMNVPKEGIELLTTEYQLLSKKIPGSFYAYFIRPFAQHKLYNGIFLLLLRRPLEEQEFIELKHLWTKILSETTLIKIEKFARATEQEFIFEEQTHIWNTEIAPITQHLDIAFKRISEDNSFPLEISLEVECAFLRVQELRMINAFNLFLMKTRGMKSSKEINETLSHIGDENILREFQIRTTSLNQVLLDVIGTLVAFIKSLEYVDRDIAEKELFTLTELKTKVSGLKIFSVQAIAAGLKIIILDLLKNALLHADKVNPKVDVQIKMNGKYLEIHFLNNNKLSKEAFDYINFNKAGAELSMRRKGGIRTIKRIIGSPLLNSSGLQWQIKALETSLTRNTDIMLLIPKADIHE